MHYQRNRCRKVNSGLGRHIIAVTPQAFPVVPNAIARNCHITSVHNAGHIKAVKLLGISQSNSEFELVHKTVNEVSKREKPTGRWRKRREDKSS